MLLRRPGQNVLAGTMFYHYTSNSQSVSMLIIYIHEVNKSVLPHLSLGDTAKATLPLRRVLIAVWEYVSRGQIFYHCFSSSRPQSVPPLRLFEPLIGTAVTDEMPVRENRREFAHSFDIQRRGPESMRPSAYLSLSSVNVISFPPRDEYMKPIHVPPSTFSCIMILRGSIQGKKEEKV